MNSASDASRRMAATRGKDNPRELALRSLLHRRGLRFRVHYRIAALPRRSIDIAFPSRRLAVYSDGCFWHGCPLHATLPRTNGTWWREKLARNVERDRDTDHRLRTAGWRIVRIWEHVPLEAAVDRVVVAWDEATAT